TVSRILLGDPLLNVRESTRVRILQAAAELRYVPNPHARGLRTARSHALCFALSEYGHPVAVDIVRSVEAAAAQRGYTVSIIHLGPHLATLPLQRRAVLGHRVDGFIIYRQAAEQFLDDIDALGVPRLILGRPDPTGGPAVRVDEGAAVQLALSHLRGLGHWRIGLLLSTPDKQVADEHLQHFAASFDGASDQVVFAGPSYGEALVAAA